MSQTTLIMNSDRTFTTTDDGFIGIAEWAALNGVSERSVKRWLTDDEIPGAEQRGAKQKWFIPSNAMRITAEERVARKSEVAVIADTPSEVVLAPIEPEVEIDEEFQDHLWRLDLESYLARMPTYIPVRIGAAMLGLGIGFVKANAEEFGILHRAGPNQTDVMPKLIILRRSGLAQ